MAETSGSQTEIHPDAEVAETAELGSGCRIGPGAQIGPRVRMGNNCRIGPRAQLTGSIRMGHDNLVETGAVLAGETLVRNYPAAGDSSGEEPEIIIGDGNIIREYALLGESSKTASRLNLEDKSIIIGDDNFLMAYTVINPGVQLDSRIKIANASCLKPGVKIGSGAFLAGMVVVAAGVEVGEMAMLGGHSHLNCDLPPYLLADGVPARVKTMNAVALRRSDVKRSTFREVKQIFKDVFRQTEDQEAREDSMVNLCPEEGKSDHAQKLINFIADRENLCPGGEE